MNKSYDELNKMVSEYSAHKKNTIMQYESELEENRTRVMEYSKKSLEAIEAEDLKAFKAAKSASDDAKSMCEYLSGQLKKVTAGQEEADEIKAKELLDRVLDSYSDDISKYVSDIRNTLDELVKKSEAFLENRRAAVGIVERWHSEVRPYKKLIGHNGDDPVYQKKFPEFPQTGFIDSFVGDIDSFREDLNDLEAITRKGES